MKFYSILVLASNVAGSLERANLYELNSLQDLDSTLGIDGVADAVRNTAPQEINWQPNRPAPGSRDSSGIQRQGPSTENPGGYNQRYNPFINTPSTRPQNTGGSNQRYNPTGSEDSSGLQPQAPSTENSGGYNQNDNPFLNQPSTRPQNPNLTSPNETTRNTGYLPDSNHPDRQTDTATNNQQSDGNCQLLQSNSGRGSESKINDLYPSYKGQCTEWADGRYYQLTGHHVDFLNGFYDARFWPQKASEKGWQVGSTPLVASIMALQPQQGEIGETGHVAIVESISGNSICTSNWNFPIRGNLTMKTFDLRALPPSVRYLTHHWGSGRNLGRYNQRGRGYY
ncbi:hypothetical protein DSO57_1027096 [Entomophthora muscae]|uniref:Uncharacterized protein n=2 Tax=Entomophthora muscae TaxID=34485 RepID=A0ACC2U1C8_9FUNG|nr:hypothetical protein DSO57_1027095 [Entomophthora muscae]KAJ9080252.1 hypothetical protein DSO57_1027096 [Entomophthora muscae]